MLSFPTASLLLFIAITNIPTGLAAKECYLPNGLPPPAASDELIPCKAYGTVHSACCKNGQACSSNGLCQAPHERDRFWRGGCTDITFNDPACPRYCLVNGPKAQCHSRSSVLTRCRPKNCPCSCVSVHGDNILLYE
ncbi:hypothetical protein B0J11DRAFT_347371 [Dendryphion nanum]|uniref:Uncharacterized protein n=1 Tax=Dendryphion nanum TaxID=256645 RepID=A0A9P9DP09_9PLEO|nr:hypothetical protein B0J11DRAFT_347371 [Dendryphion nanum]